MLHFNIQIRILLQHIMLSFLFANIISSVFADEAEPDVLPGTSTVADCTWLPGS